MVSKNLALKIGLTLALAGCSMSRENDAYGTFYEPGSEYSFRGQKILILYATDEKLSEQKLSKNGIVRWPEPKSPELIEDVTKRLRERGAYISFRPVFSDDSDLSLRVCQYDKDWNVLLITYPEFNPAIIRDENLNSVYLTMLHEEKLVIGKLGTMNDFIPLGSIEKVMRSNSGLKYMMGDKSKGIF
ncbi:MAG: hypothetical protein AABX96_03585 [Nanoarchaeota archaeon]